MRRRFGFTLIELLVTIAILGLLLAVLLPAVQGALELSRSAECKSHLRQIGLAMRAYQTGHGVFPISMVGHGGKPNGSTQCRTGFYSWMTSLLPYIDETAVYDSINFDVGMSDRCDASSYVAPGATIGSAHPNYTAATTRISMFLCPSDRFLALDAMGSSRIQPSSYMGNAGWPWNSTGINGTRSTVGRHNGIIGLVNPDRPVSWHDGDVRMEDVTDGMEYTIAVAERRIGNVQDAMDIILKRAYPTELSYCGGGNTPRVDLKAYSLSCSKASAADITYTRAHGRSWISGWTLAASTYLHVRPMNDINCHLYGGEPEGSNLVSPSSRHSGGIHVLMADGRVVFLSEGIDEHIWWGMGSRDGGEPNHFDE